jgi:thymidine phosphorylase
LAECKIGQEVHVGEVMGTVFNADAAAGETAAARIRDAYEIGDAKPEQPELIKEVVE